MLFFPPLHPLHPLPPLLASTDKCLNRAVLGGGGFGKTYLAEDIDKLNEPCVIKQFAPQVQGTGALNKATELFEQEAKRLQQLGEHPQIPTLLAYFEENNRLYLVQGIIKVLNLLHLAKIARLLLVEMSKVLSKFGICKLVN